MHSILVSLHSYIKKIDSRLAFVFQSNIPKWQAAILTFFIFLWTGDIVFRFLHPGQTFAATALALIVSILLDIFSIRYFYFNKSSQILVLLSLLLFISVGFCLSQIFALWQLGTGNYFSIGALIPYSDAVGYYSGARSLAEFGRILDSVSIHRPLAPAFYGLLLLLTGQNLQEMLLINALFLGLAIGIASWALFSTHGFSAALIMALSLCSFSRAYISTTLMEPVALIFAAPAFAFLWVGFYNLRKPLVYAGIFLLSIAMAVRTGPVWLIPLLAGYAGFALKKTRKYSVKTCVCGMLLLLFVLLANYGLVELLAPGKSASFNGNFSLVLYGLAKGGTGWGQFYSDFGSLVSSGVSESVITASAYQAAIHTIANSPLLLIKGIIKMFLQFLIHAYEWFCPFDSYFGQIPAFLLFVSCFFFFLRNYKKQKRLVIIALLWLFSVVAGAPFYADISNRILASVWPFLCAITAAGFAETMRNVSTSHTHELAVEPRSFWSKTARIATVSSFVFLCLPVIAHFLARHPDHNQMVNSAQKCITDKDTNIVFFRASRNSFLHIQPDSNSCIVPEIRISPYRIFAWNYFDVATEGQYVGSIMDLFVKHPGQYPYVIMNEDPAAFAGKIVAVSLRFIGARDPGHTVYYARIVDVLE
jgi:hypothetical protein